MKVQATALSILVAVFLTACAITRPQSQAPNSVALRLASFSGEVSQSTAWDIESAPGWLCAALPNNSYPPKWTDFHEMFCTNYPIGSINAPLVVKKTMQNDAQVSVNIRHEIQTYRANQGDFTKSFWLTCKNATIPLNTWVLISSPGTDEERTSGLFVKISKETTHRDRDAPCGAPLPHH